MLTTICKGITKTGKGCSRKIKNGSYCYNHIDQKVVEKNVKDTLPCSSSSLLSDEECPICFDVLSSTDVLECNHKIHISCIEKSFKAECPLCRCPLTKLDKKVLKNIEANFKKIEEERRIEEEQATQELIRELAREILQNQGMVDILKDNFVCQECEVQNSTIPWIRGATEGSRVFIVRLT